ncbi:DUF4163 domain-containing protein [Sphingobium lignivorans]|uniref:Deacetylase PdaC domain-containing protein n=1 Tax=Sphingobium lignivorans TaxID=2735886 RepID=A0ABR6NL84_9SPHN|nr:DUF4163 domain-containing protein [Sphingobium lignivorans]MBB5987263.1 hypothetical protein [Sphingobium lignivorans]
MTSNIGKALLVALMLSASACKSDGAGNLADNAMNGAAPANAANAATPAPDGETIAFEKDQVEFRYSWPGAAAAIAPLAASLRAEGEKLRKETEEAGRKEQASAKEGGYPYRGYSLTQDWQLAADVPALLVLQSEGYTFTGGAHGMPFVNTLMWDKAGGRRLALDALFDSAALVNAIRARFCGALDAEREKRRGAPVDPNASDGIPEFSRCVDPAKQVILPVSAGGRTLDTIRVVILPYEAGPYAEGIYQLDLPVDDAVRAAVKPAWRSAFGAGA